MRFPWLKFLLAIPVALLACLAVFAATGWLLRPPQAMGPSPNLVDPQQVDGARQTVRLAPTAPTFVVDVDYAAGRAASWWPRGESPILAGMVAAGTLPPVEERVGGQPMVIRGVEGTGRFGGSWMRVGTHRGDIDIAMRFITTTATLVRWSPQGEPLQPNLARAWESNADATEWTFHLRRGIRWSDGHPFSAEDIRFACEVLYPYLMTPEGAATPVRELSWLEHRGRYGRLAVDAPDRVRFIFEQAHPLFPERLARGQFDDLVHAPRHYLQPFVPEPGGSLASRPELARRLQQTGFPDGASYVRALLADDNPELPRMTPWIYRRHQSGPPISYLRNPFFWAVDEEGNQLPYLDEILFHLQQEQQVATTAASGGMSMQHRHLRFPDYTLLMNSRDRNPVRFDILHWYPGDRSAWVIFPNLNRVPNPADPQSPRKVALLSNPHFRQALSLALDRRRIIDSLYLGLGTPSQLEPGPDSPFHHGALATAFVRHDPGDANRLLDGLGLATRDRRGYRTFPDGSEMTWFIDYTSFTGPGPVALVVDDWKQVGIRVVSRERSRPLFLAEQRNGWMDFMVWSGGGEILPLVEPRSFAPVGASSLSFALWGRWYQAGGFHGTQTAATGLVAPPADHPTREVLTLLDQARSEPDPQLRRALLDRILTINAHQVWTINIASPPPVLVLRDRDLRNVPEVAVQSFLLSSPGNVAPESFFFAHDTFADGTPRATPARTRILQEYLQTPLPNPSLAPDASALDRPSLLGSFLRGLLILAAVLIPLLVILRHPFIGRRLALMIPMLVIVSVITFTTIQIPPGNLVETRLAELEAQGGEAATRSRDDLRRLYWLDDPAWLRYARWMGLPWFLSFQASDRGLLQGDLGRSMESDQSVNALIGDRLALTVGISAGTILFTWLLAIPIGIYSAVRQYTWADHFVTVLGIIGMCVPSFLLALLLGFFGKTYFGIEMTGLFSPQYAAQPFWNLPKFLDLLAHLWVPVVVLGIGGTAGMIRVMRSNLLDELGRPYVTTARAKGLHPLRLLLKYPVRLALNPFVSTIGGLFPSLVSGGAVVSIVLGLPTIGPLLLGALLSEDMYMAGSLLVVLSLLGMVGTLVSDLLLLWLDPRIRMEGGAP